MTTGPETTATGPPDGSQDERLTRVENKLDALVDTVAKLIPGTHAQAEQREEQKLDAPTSVEEQVRAELQRAREEQADADAKNADAADRQSVKDRLAALEEKPPTPPRARRTVLLGWGDGRQ